MVPNTTSQYMNGGGETHPEGQRLVHGVPEAAMQYPRQVSRVKQKEQILQNKLKTLKKARWKLRGSPKSVGFVLWGPQTLIFHGNPSDNCWDISFWTKAVDRQTHCFVLFSRKRIKSLSFHSELKVFFPVGDFLLLLCAGTWTGSPTRFHYGGSQGDRVSSWHLGHREVVTSCFAAGRRAGCSGGRWNFVLAFESHFCPCKVWVSG